MIHFFKQKVSISLVEINVRYMYMHT